MAAVRGWLEVSVAKDLRVTDSRGRAISNRKALRLDYDPGTFVSDFGCLGVIGNAAFETFAANTPKNWTTWAPVDPLVQKGTMITDPVAGTIIVPKAGAHYIFFSASVSVPSVAVLIASIAVDGVPNPILVIRDRDGGASNPSTVASAGYTYLPAGSVLSFQLEVPSNLNLTLTDGSFGVWRMSD
jgi:hypothetical protein